MRIKQDVTKWDPLSCDSSPWQMLLSKSKHQTTCRPNDNLLKPPIDVTFFKLVNLTSKLEMKHKIRKAPQSALGRMPCLCHFNPGPNECYCRKLNTKLHVIQQPPKTPSNDLILPWNPNHRPKHQHPERKWTPASPAPDNAADWISALNCTPTKWQPP